MTANEARMASIERADVLETETIVMVVRVTLPNDMRKVVAGMRTNIKKMASNVTIARDLEVEAEVTDLATAVLPEITVATTIVALIRVGII